MAVNDNINTPKLSIKCFICLNEMDSKSLGVIDTPTWRLCHENCEENARKDIERQVHCCPTIHTVLGWLIRYNVFDNCYAIYKDMTHEYGGRSKSYIVNGIKHCPFCSVRLFKPPNDETNVKVNITNEV